MSARRVQASVAVYAAFAFGAIAWRGALGSSALHSGLPLGGTRAIALPFGLSMGALCGVFCVWASRRAMRGTAWGHKLALALGDNVTSVPTGSLGLLALCAAVGEELLFRGALFASLCPSTGPVMAVALSSLCFGLLHIPWSRELIPWTLSALAMGVVFAGLYLVTGEVLTPIAAHAVINYENLRFLRMQRPERPLGRERLGPPNGPPKARG